MHGDVSFHWDDSGKTAPRKPTRSFPPPQYWGVPCAPDLPNILGCQLPTHRQHSGVQGTTDFTTGLLDTVP